MDLLYYKNKLPNFGDDLNAVLWPSVAPDLFQPDAGNGFVGIGTIIGKNFNHAGRLHVFSSGVGNDLIENWASRDTHYWCVRGPISARALDLPADRAITDGAILTPLAEGFPDRAGAGKGTVVIPHHWTLDYPGWQQACDLAGMELLSPAADPHSVIARIADAKLVITESLHGAILADTYGIPWTVFGTSGNFGISKFVDWASTVGLNIQLRWLPPPNADQLLEQGRGPGQWGDVETLTLDRATATLHQRLAPADPHPGLVTRIKSGIKTGIKTNPALRPLMRRALGYTPARTAEALTALANGPTQLSTDATRERLVDTMLGRLREVRAFNQGMLVSA